MGHRCLRVLHVLVFITAVCVLAARPATAAAPRSPYDTGKIGANHGSAVALTPLEQGGIGLHTVGWVPESSAVARGGAIGGHGMDDLYEGYNALWLPEWKTDQAKEGEYTRPPLKPGEGPRRFYQGSLEWVQEILIPTLRTGNAMDQAAGQRIENALQRGRSEGDPSRYIRYLYVHTYTPAYTGEAEAYGEVRVAKLQYGRVTTYERMIPWRMKDGRPQIVQPDRCSAPAAAGLGRFTMSPAVNPSPAARAVVTAGQAADAARVVMELVAPFVKARNDDAMAQEAYRQLGVGVAHIQHMVPARGTGWVRVTLGGPQECVDDTQGFTVRVGFHPATGNVTYLGPAACQPGARREVTPLRTGRVGRQSWESVPAPQSTLSPPGWTYVTYDLCVASAAAPAVAAASPPTAPPAAQLQPNAFYAYVLEGIGLVVATPETVAKTPHCSWNGGGPRPCPGAPPAKALGTMGGPYASVEAAKADLKTKLNCSNGHWGTFINYGNDGKATAWLQNNVTGSDCKTLKQL